MFFYSHNFTLPLPPNFKADESSVLSEEAEKKKKKKNLNFSSYTLKKCY